MPLVEIENLSKVYRKGAQEVPVLARPEPVRRGRRVRRADGAVGVRQDDAAEPHRRDRPADVRARSASAGRTSSRLSRNKLAAWRARHVGYIFQLYNLIPVLTAFENVELPLLLLPLSRAERRKRVEVALGAVGLLDRYDHYPRQLSGGQEQRVAIARAIVADPTIIVADEPTGDLDAETADATLNLLTRLNEEMGKTLVMVTHDPRAAAAAKRLVRLEKGRLVDDVLPARERLTVRA